MHTTLAVNYPDTFDRKFCLGKLPPVRKPLERKMCVGRVWIFLLLGVFLLILGLVSFGIYLNIDGVTSSSKFTEILPLYINSGVIVFVGLVVTLLFWRRFKVLVFVCVVVCVASGFLCGITAVLTGTHVIVPLNHLTSCRYYRSQDLCQCVSPYRRQMLALDYSEKDVTKYEFENVSSCESIQEVLPQLLYALVATYGVAFFTCLVSAILALLVLRAERLKRGFFSDEAYEEVYTVSGHSSQDQSDCESEVNADVIVPSFGQSLQAKNRTPRASNSDTINRIPGASLSDTINRTPRGSNSDTINSTRSNIPISRSGTSNSTSISSLQNKPVPKLSKSLAPHDLAKETLANRYRINKTPDREVTYRHRISKTPDREVGASRRRNSFVLAKRLSKSCDSLESSGTSQENINGFGTDIHETKKKGRLKEHRRKGKRAATVATLDTDQLLLILNLQMRYLQETKEQNSAAQLNSYPRRAITPQPTSAQKIPPKIRSHTPQPQRANTRKRSSAEQEFYAQIKALQTRCTPTDTNSQNFPNSVTTAPGARTVRNASDTSVDTCNISQGPGNQLGVQRCSSVDRSNGNQDRCLRSDTKLHPGHVTEGYNPYLHNYPPQINSVDNVHFLTYTDNMHRRQDAGLRTRASVQNQTLPPQPLHRGGGKYQLPPQPISRHRNNPVHLPPQPLHRGQSAFHVVDKGSKSRSPSVASDIIDTSTKRKQTKDLADVAIRENFKLNPSPFLLQDSVSSPHVNGFSCQGRTEGDGRRQAEDPLPPYSGPPSYREYVSSCDNSVDSSLSSNPDDVYSMPKRRVSREQNLANQNNSNRLTANQKDSSKTLRNMSNQIPQYRPATNQYDSDLYSTNQNGPFRNDAEHSKRDRNFNVFGNNSAYKTSEGIIEPRQCENYENSYSPSITQSDEALYSFPVKKSKVKQCIVPEDYYAPINKTGYHGNIYANEPSTRDNYDMSHQVSIAGYDGDYGNGKSLSTSAPRSGQSSSASKSPIVQVFNPGSDHQIAPDAKYHEYEDVYDSSANVAKYVNNGCHGDTSTVPFSYHNNGMGFGESQKLNPSASMGRNKSPSLTRHAPVSNVSACSPKLTTEGSQINPQVLPSVQNVHATNIQNIPRIKLNDPADTSGEMTDDDVFVDSNVYRYSEPIPVSQTARVIDFSGPVPQQTNIREPSFYVTNEITGPGHVTDSTNQETESGYVKMTLPEKNRIVDSYEAEQDMPHGEVTGIGSQDVPSVRHHPDGIEQVKPETQPDHYEETGV